MEEKRKRRMTFHSSEVHDHKQRARLPMMEQEPCRCDGAGGWRPILS